MAEDVRLETIDETVQGKHAHIRAEKLPIIESNSDRSTRCGKCDEVIVDNGGPELLYKAFETPQILIVECTCGALNEVPRVD